MLQTQSPIEAFTMSVDRGFLGRPPPEDFDSPSIANGSAATARANAHRSMDDLAIASSSHRLKPKNTGMELVRLLQEAEKGGYSPEDLQAAINHAQDADPVEWLHENWVNMIDTVVTLVNSSFIQVPN